MCLFCFSSEPLSSDEVGKGKYGAAYGAHLNDSDTFQITMCQTPCKEPGCWCASMLCCCCSQMVMRKKVLNHVNPGSGWDDYKCCQGFYGGCCCLQPGQLCESSCPVPCLTLEICLCPGPAASATSLVLRNKYHLGLDKDDVRLIRCNNCIFCASVILGCLRICIDSDALDCAYHCASCTSDVVFMCTAGCMLGQAHHEVKCRERGGAPTGMAMLRF
mmetsp:Transcript_11204/g.26398  ORF Transcript_11204/g.26398 Transcript_11204/m.26398 type:complete len:217 (+) Transcript_11204:245-895(+)